ncbi:peptidoglycan-binding protein [Streptomyces sp. NPDC050388]|uniref:peptidoglycan-binding protein n=1 Tax=Streptomyces sp. NPDC050388 TaxID=3155781 RepID=UPI003445E928
METPCPECGAPRNRDNTPSCACGPRASDALREARTAQAAAVEDFHPLRIRPYVEFDDGTPATTPNAAPGHDPVSEHDAAPDHTPEPEAGPETAPPAPTEDRPDAPPAADATMQLRVVPPDATSAPPSATPDPTPAPTPLAAPLAPPTTEPNATDLHLFEATRPTRAVPAAAGPATNLELGPDAGGPASRDRRRRRTALLTAAGAVVAVAGAAGWASGLFAYEAPSRDGALPDDVRVSVPDAPSVPPSASASPSEGASPSASPSLLVSASASPSESASPSASPSVSASEDGASASPSDTAEPSSAAPTTAPAEAPEEVADEEVREVTGAVLRRGDRGPEVVELQHRLRQLYLYNSELHGRFNRRLEDALRNYQWSRGISGDELGVYGPETRSRLESETREP